MTVYVENTNNTGTNYTDTDVADGVTYTYRVKAINGETIGEQSDAVSRVYRENVYNWIGTSSLLKQPTGLQGWNTASGMQLQWQHSDAHATGYKILRRRPELCEPFQVQVANTNSIKTHWIDESNENGVSYQYRIAAIKDNHESRHSGTYDVDRINSFRPAWIATVSNFAVFAGARIYITGGFSGLEIDDDSSTVDYTIRSDVTRADDGSDADQCEGDGFGIERQMMVVESRGKQFTWTFGGPGCGIGTYKITHVLQDRNGDQLSTTTSSYVMMGPVITGRAQVDQTLAADVSTIASNEDYSNASYRYQWQRSNGTTYENISGAINSTYTVVAGDIGRSIEMLLRVEDNLGQADFKRSEPTAAVVPVNSAPSGTLGISGNTVVGQTLAADTSGITDADGLASVSYVYQWLTNDGATDAEIQDATGSTYVLTDSDPGKTIKVRVAFTDDNGNDESLTSGATGTVKPQLTAAVYNSSTDHNGTDAFKFDLWFNQNIPGLSYKVLRSHAFTVTGGTVKNARRLNPPGNIRWEITVQPAGNDAVAVVLPMTTDCLASGAICSSGSNMLSNRLEFNVPGPTPQAANTDATGSSQNTAPTGQPTISGIAKVGHTLTVSTANIADDDGLTNPSYTYQWVANAGGSDSEIQDATAGVYTPAVGDVARP